MADGTVLETITLEEAQQVIDAAAKKATQIGQPMDIAVVDAGGNLKAHVRMDGATRPLRSSARPGTCRRPPDHTAPSTD
ncbi:MAG: hypothetical protein PVSMB10_14890 [Pseudarthrobacter sp.]